MDHSQHLSEAMTIFLGMWYFDSYYELHQQVDDDISDTQELAKLITSSGSTSVFYSFDPSFYSIMQTLSSSIALMFPYDDDIAVTMLTISLILLSALNLIRIHVGMMLFML